MCYSTKKLILTVFIAISITFIACQQSDINPPIAGEYGEHVILGYNASSQEISGIYKDEINTEEQADSCYFYFVGKFAGAKTNIISWRIGNRQEEVFGVLEMKASLSFQLELERKHINCHAAENFQSSDRFTCIRPTNWRYIRTVKKPSANLYGDMSTRIMLDTVLSKGAILKILDKKIDWVEVEVGNLKGWMEEKDLIRFPG